MTEVENVNPIEVEAEPETKRMKLDDVVVCFFRYLYNFILNF